MPQYGADDGTIRRAVADAERPGFDSAWLEDHLQSWIGEKRRDASECWTTFAALASKAVYDVDAALADQSNGRLDDRYR